MTKIKPVSFSAPLASWDIFLANYRQLMQKGDDLEMLKAISGKANWQVKWDLKEELVAHDHVIVVTDVKRKIVFASNNIADMTGYSPKELLGKSPKMLQGSDTDQEKLKYIRESIAAKQPFEATIVNYRKDGEAYGCHIKAFPVFDAENKLVNFIAFEKAA
ncbi:PAS domain-containing protein [Ferruginibacter sp. HRS2-29]|uniref:PAS domain-containing protein n=1 Tax=Ferruginibacter sp. HRS2-29 TaxID=2487334 RepID=UPI0020CFD1EB|nr:PAS domain-containing protein [Ferruginibacter sp. HRS2-29]MCP9750383.1 PAS domain-containing protein [Ferruginibacter sp. HRS2-29]